MKHMVNLVFAAGVSFAASAEGLSVSGLTAQSYVQRGLVANWDGIENAGRYGEHRESITAWKDLVAGATWTLPANAVVGEDCVTYAGSAASWNTAYTAATISKVRNGTLEAAFYVTEACNGQILFGGSGYRVSMRADSSADKLTLTASGGANVSQAICPILGLKNTACVTFLSDTPQTAYTNGFETTFNGVGRINTTDNKVYSGGGLMGSIYAMRMYGVALTADEARYNAVVDAVRFKGEDPATAFVDCALARWNESAGALEVKIQVTTTGSGKFSLNGGAPVDSIDQWIALGEDVSIVYTATGEQPMWMDLPAYAAREEGDGCSASFTVSGPVTARVAPAQIVYVDDTASGDGSAWNATTSWNGALDLAAAATQPVAIWVKGPVELTATPAAKTFSVPVAFRGGFAGGETSLAARLAGARSVVSGKGSYNHLNFANDERVTFDGISLERMGGTALTRTQSNGSLYMTNSAIRGIVSATTHGATLNGATGARLRLVDSEVEGCGRGGSISVQTGLGMSATGFGATEFDNVLFATNGLGGMRQETGSALYLKDTRFKLLNSRFAGNWAYGEYSNGQVFRFEGDCDGSVVSNCAFVGNYECKAGAAGGIISVSFDSDARKLAFENCTFAYNIVRRWNSGSCTDATALNVLVGDVTVRNSIFWGNVKQSGCTAGADMKAFGTSSLTAEYCLFGGKGANYYTAEDTATLNVVEATCVFDKDPLFVTPTDTFKTLAGVSALPTATPSMGSLTADEALTLDVHLLSAEGYRVNGSNEWYQAAASSPAIDKGDPADGVRDEPPGHNGGRLNLGAYGGTRGASQTALADVRVVGDVTVDFDTSYTQPTVRFTAGGTGAYAADVVVSLSTNGVDWISETVGLSDITNGQAVAVLVPFYLLPGGNVTAHVRLSAAGSSVEQDSAATPVTGTLPPWYGKGGPANVIHVRAGATGKGTGANWTDALTDFSTALGLLGGDKTEIWFSGDITVQSIPPTLTIKVSTAFRGGFTGAESDPSERTDARRAVIIGDNTYTPFKFTNSDLVTLDGLEFRRPYDVAAEKSGGDGGVVVTNCVVIRPYYNASQQVPNGMKLIGTAAATLTVVDSWFSECMTLSTYYSQNDAASGALYLSGFGSATVDRCLFTSNGYNCTSAAGKAIKAVNTPIAVRNSRFAGNDSYGEGAGGSVVYLSGTVGGSEIRNCAFVGNSERCSNTRGCVTLAASAADDELLVENCTFAYNTSAKNPGDSNPQAFDATGLNVRSGTAYIRNCIFWANCSKATNTGAADLGVFAGATAHVSYCLFADSTAEYLAAEEGGTLDLDEDTCVFGKDPQFVTPTADFMSAVKISQLPKVNCTIAPADGLRMDAHLLSMEGYRVNGSNEWYQAAVTSPAIDKADPSDDVGGEMPGYNGSRRNLGAYGGTWEASLTARSDVKVVGDVEVVFDGEFTQPTVRFTAGGSGAYTADATISVSTNGTDWLSETVHLQGVTNGQSVVELLPFYLLPGGNVKARVKLEASDSASEKDSADVTIKGKLPPWYGKGGPANVIHVRAGATGRGTGENWTDALTDYRAALARVGGDKTEVWFAGDFTLDSTPSPLTISVPTAFRGGFAGTECDPSERQQGARSVIDGMKTCNPLQFGNAAAVTVDSLSFVDARSRGIEKTGGAGDLTVTNCAVLRARYGSGSYAKAGSFTGTAEATLRVVDCEFRECGEGTGTIVGDGKGRVLCIYTFKEAVVDRCLFVGNSESTPRGAQAGSVIYAKDTRTLLRHSRFSGNGANGEYTGWQHVMIAGDSNGSRVENCAFVGNHENCGGSPRGTLCFDLGAGCTGDVVNCTFAFNMSWPDGIWNKAHCDPTGLSAYKGVVNVRNCIFFGNTTNGKGASPADLYVYAGATGRVDHCLFSSAGTNSFAAAAGGTLELATNTCEFVDPLFVTTLAEFKALAGIKSEALVGGKISADDAAALNVHLRGGTGYRDETTGEVVKDWTRRRYGDSPAIDAGDPKVKCVEPHPNGWRVNLGCYGNTPWATLSKGGTVLIVR